jgi:hypothetical protein
MFQLLLESCHNTELLIWLRNIPWHFEEDWEKLTSKIYEAARSTWRSSIFCFSNLLDRGLIRWHWD